ncbi:ribbon-helix-helix domain-containing protein [Niveispirillum sp.]|uniref:ribbon-helix-helix domain-containing protein n=1 Tax=Niveispirillum sp. TaxID=1917217 RepID=UPI001B622884|nr:ribbon-helix-helix domain-containing protein [Niveispirillum sp.]
MIQGNDELLGDRISRYLANESQGHPVNISVHGHRTSFRLEPVFRKALQDIAAREEMSIEHLYGIIDQARGDHALSAALRLFAVSYWGQVSGLLVGRGWCRDRDRLGR